MLSRRSPTALPRTLSPKTSRTILPRRHIRSKRSRTPGPPLDTADLAGSPFCSYASFLLRSSLACADLLGALPPPCTTRFSSLSDRSTCSPGACDFVPQPPKPCRDGCHRCMTPVPPVREHQMRLSPLVIRCRMLVPPMRESTKPIHQSAQGYRMPVTVHTGKQAPVPNGDGTRIEPFPKPASLVLLLSDASLNPGSMGRFPLADLPAATSCTTSTRPLCAPVESWPSS